ncbi:hypothetical protein EV359DRAFT_63533, partial [Lentinula novae-zelandiae]
NQSLTSGKITAAFVVVLVVPILVVNLLIYLAFRKHSSFLLEKNHTSMFVRVSIFTLFGLVSAIVGLIFFFLNQINTNSGKVRVGMNIILAIIPVAAVLVFGTHKLSWLGPSVKPVFSAKSSKAADSRTVQLGVLSVLDSTLQLVSLLL